MPGPARAPRVFRYTGVVKTSAGASEPGTRARVARMLVERGPQTVAALCAELGLTAAGVRRHLDALVAEGAVTARETHVRGPRGRGRPSRTWAVTDTGRASTGEQAYDDLAEQALSFLQATGGDAAVDAFAQARAGSLEERYASAGGDPERLAELLSGDGYAASVSPVGSGTTLCQHHCPVQHVAAAFPQLCEAETQALSRLLGSHVQRLATLAHGDGVCTTHIPARVPSPATEGSLL